MDHITFGGWVSWLFMVPISLFYLLGAAYCIHWLYIKLLDHWTAHRFGGNLIKSAVDLAPLFLEFVRERIKIDPSLQKRFPRRDYPKLYIDEDEE